MKFLTSPSLTDDIKPVPLFLLNAGPGSVHVSVSIEMKKRNLHLTINYFLQSISTVPPNEAIQIQYTPTTLRQASKYVRIASILYHGK